MWVLFGTKWLLTNLFMYFFFLQPLTSAWQLQTPSTSNQLDRWNPQKQGGCLRCRRLHICGGGGDRLGSRYLQLGCDKNDVLSPWSAKLFLQNECPLQRRRKTKRCNEVLGKNSSPWLWPWPGLEKVKLIWAKSCPVCPVRSVCEALGQRQKVTHIELEY